MGLGEWIENVKESLGIYWELLLLIIGAVLPTITSKSINYIKKQKASRKLRKYGSNEDLNVQTISSHSNFYKDDKIDINIRGRAFYLEFPNHLLEGMLKKDSDYIFHKDTFLETGYDLEKYSKVLEIPDLVDIIETKRIEVAWNFLKGENGCKFIRPKYGVYSIQSTHRAGKYEEPELKLELYETDYFTHRVMREVYKDLKTRSVFLDQFHQSNIVSTLKRFNIFTTSLGINILVEIDSQLGRSFIFSKRSGEAAHSENSYKFNSTVMEGISQTDYDEKERGVSLNLAAKRALREELGIKDSLSPNIFIYDFFLEKNYFELGFTASAEFDGEYEKILRDLPAQDKEMEIDKLEAVSIGNRSLNTFVKTHNFFPQGLYTLKMISARKNINIVHSK